MGMTEQSNMTYDDATKQKNIQYTKNRLTRP